jgi:uncharacterized protein
MGSLAIESKLQKPDRIRAIRTLWKIRHILKWLPSKRSIGRYPMIGRFGSYLKKRNYLWCFQEDRVGPAILIGSIVAFLPIFGIQLITVMAIALILKINLPVIAGMQFISNPFTLAPIYFANYKVGNWLLGSAGLGIENTGGFISGVNSTMLGGIVLGSAFGLFAYLAYRMQLKTELRTSKVAL